MPDNDMEPPAKKQRREDVVEVMKLTQKDLSSYSITDVVLPLPGYRITYPVYGTENYYEEILVEDKIKNSDFDHRVK